jgi:hypothetical protein
MRNVTKSSKIQSNIRCDHHYAIQTQVGGDDVSLALDEEVICVVVLVATDR